MPRIQQPAGKLSVSATIRRLVLADQTMVAKDIEAKLTEAGFPGTRMRTIVTIRADALATLREAAALGLLVTKPGAAALGLLVHAARPATSQACQPLAVASPVGTRGGVFSTCGTRDGRG